ncbi:MAG: hypothetical protein JO302_02275 [Candidatus Eremiobacteraeota bacterium]|nr:hypothetical protein [Candidatus Eremiobacteraeota bacterium]
MNVDNDTVSFSDTRPPVPRRATVTVSDGVVPVIAATIDGIPTTVVVDTGDRSSLTLFGPFAKHYGFYGRYPSEKNVITGYGLGGPVYADVFTMPQLDVLGTPLAGIVTRASRQTGGVFTSSEQGGSIGTGLLKRFNILYDYAHQKIFAWPSKYFKQTDSFIPPPPTGIDRRGERMC